MRPVSRGEVLELGAYEAIRPQFQARVIAEKRPRRVAVGSNLTLLFENRDTVLFQIQEMLRTERITKEAGVLHEIETYNSLVPAANELTATGFVEYPEAAERDRMLVALAGLEACFYVEVGDERVMGVNETHGVFPDRTTAVHYLRFPLGQRLADAARAGAPLKVGVEHAAYRAAVTLAEASRAALVADLNEP